MDIDIERHKAVPKSLITKQIRRSNREWRIWTGCLH